MFLELGCSLD